MIEFLPSFPLERKAYYKSSSTSGGGSVNALLIESTGDFERDCYNCPGSHCRHKVALRTERGDYLHTELLDAYTIFVLSKFLHVSIPTGIAAHFRECQESFVSVGIVCDSRMRFAENLCLIADRKMGFKSAIGIGDEGRAIMKRLRDNAPWRDVESHRLVLTATTDRIIEKFGLSPQIPEHDIVHEEEPLIDISQLGQIVWPPQLPNNNQVDLPPVEAENDAELHADNATSKRERKPVQRYKPSRQMTPKKSIAK